MNERFKVNVQFLYHLHHYHHHHHDRLERQFTIGGRVERLEDELFHNNQELRAKVHKLSLNRHISQPIINQWRMTYSSIVTSHTRSPLIGTHSSIVTG